MRFTSILAEQEHLANQPDLDSCPECGSPLVERDGEKICHTCGTRQPIIDQTFDELAPGIRQEVMDNGYSHADKLMAMASERSAFLPLLLPALEGIGALGEAGAAAGAAGEAAGGAAAAGEAGAAAGGGNLGMGQMGMLMNNAMRGNQQSAPAVQPGAAGALGDPGQSMSIAPPGVIGKAKFTSIPPAEGLEYLTPDEVAETIDGISQPTYLRLWDLVGELEQANQAAPIGGDRHDPHGEFGTPMVEDPYSRRDVVSEGRGNMVSIWDKLTPEQQQEINTAYEKEFEDWPRLSKKATIFGDPETGIATQNRGENSQPDKASQTGIEGSGEIGDSPEQNKGVGADAASTDPNSGEQTAQVDGSLGDIASKAFHQNLPLVIEFAFSDQSGADHPILKALDEMLEQAFPGYKDQETFNENETGESPTEKMEEVIGQDLDDDEKDEDHNTTAGPGAAAEVKPKLPSISKKAGRDLEDFYSPIEDMEQAEGGKCPNCGEGTLMGVMGRSGIDDFLECDNCMHAFVDPEEYNEMVEESNRLYGDEDRLASHTPWEHMATPAGSVGFGYQVPGAGAVAPQQSTMMPGTGVPGAHGVEQCAVCGQAHMPGMCPLADSAGGPAGAPTVPGAALTPPPPQTVITNRVADLRDPGEVGDRVQLIRHSDPYSDLQPGAEGTIRHIDDMGTIHVQWDNGSTLGLIPQEDEYRVIGRHMGKVAAPHDEDLERFAEDEDDHHDNRYEDGPTETGWYEDWKGPQEEDDDNPWKTEDGEPLEPGQEYEMHSSQYAIPDKITVEHVGPDKIEFLIHSGDVDYRDEVDKEDVANYGYTFKLPKSNELDSESGFDAADAALPGGPAPHHTEPRKNLNLTDPRPHAAGALGEAGPDGWEGMVQAVERLAEKDAQNTNNSLLERPLETPLDEVIQHLQSWPGFSDFHADLGYEDWERLADFYREKMDELRNPDYGQTNVTFPEDWSRQAHGDEVEAEQGEGEFFCPICGIKDSFEMGKPCHHCQENEDMERNQGGGVFGGPPGAYQAALERRQDPRGPQPELPPAEVCNWCQTPVGPDGICQRCGRDANSPEWNLIRQREQNAVPSSAIDPLPQTDDISAPPTKQGHNVYTDPFGNEMEYTGSFRGDNIDSRDWLMADSSPIDVDPELMAKFAGKDFSPHEQRAFIDEEGVGGPARNLHKLDLSGTHYETEAAEFGDSFF